jgi:hypothetical protein
MYVAASAHTTRHDVLDELSGSEATTLSQGKFDSRIACWSAALDRLGRSAQPAIDRRIANDPNRIP